MLALAFHGGQVAIQAGGMTRQEEVDGSVVRRACGLGGD
jgi:hypothetical protein